MCRHPLKSLKRLICILFLFSIHLLKHFSLKWFGFLHREHTWPCAGHIDIAWSPPHLRQFFTVGVWHSHEKWFILPQFMHNSPKARQRDWTWCVPHLVQSDTCFTLQLFEKWLYPLQLLHCTPWAGQRFLLWQVPQRTHFITANCKLKGSCLCTSSQLFCSISFSHCLQNSVIRWRSNDCKYDTRYSPLDCIKSMAFPVKL